MSEPKEDAARAGRIEAVNRRDKAQQALIFSGLFCPGAGQFLQRRWLPGLLFSLLFLGCTVFLVVRVVVMVSHNLHVALDLGTDPTAEFDTVPLTVILSPLGLALVVYVVSLVDVVVANRRARRVE